MPRALTLAPQPKRLPLSPSVEIFRFPLPALASITTRFTGVGLSLGIAATGVACLVGNPVRAGPPLLPAMARSSSCLQAQLPLWIDCVTSVPALAPLVKATVAFPFVFHTLSVRRMLLQIPF